MRPDPERTFRRLAKEWEDRAAVAKTRPDREACLEISRRYQAVAEHYARFGRIEEPAQLRLVSSEDE